MLVTEVLNSNVLVQNVPNKSLSQELNNVYFVVVVAVKIDILLMEQMLPF